MGVTSIVERVRRAIEVAEAEAERSATAVEGIVSDEIRHAFRMGIAAMRRELINLLDVGPHEDPPTKSC